MADEQTAVGATSTGSKKKVIIGVGAMLLVEAVLIVGAMMLLGGDPEVAVATTMLDPLVAEGDKIVEVLVLDARLPNSKSGVPYLYSTEIYVQVKNKHVASVQNKVQQFYNEIKAETGAVWRTSEPHHFQEPMLETLTRKMYAMLSHRFGVDSESGEPIIVKCVIVMGTGFRVGR